MSLYPNHKPFFCVEDLIQTLYTHDGVEPATISWACQSRQHHVLEECIRILLRRKELPCDMNHYTDREVVNVLGLNQGYQHISSTYLFTMRAISSGDPLIMDLAHILRSNTISSVTQFNKLLEDSSVRQVYQNLILSDIKLPLKSVNQYCLVEFIKTINADPNEDLFTWFVPRPSHIMSYCQSLSFQPGQIEMLCEAFFSSMTEAAIQQRQHVVILDFIKRFISRQSDIELTQLLSSSDSPSQAQESAIPQQSPLISAFLALLQRDIVKIDSWSDFDKDQWVYLTQLREKNRPSTPLNQSLSTYLSSSQSSHSTNLQHSPSPNLDNAYSIQPNPFDNIVAMIKVLGEMRFFSSMYIYSTRQSYFFNLQQNLLPLFPQWLWPTTERLVIKILSLCLHDNLTSQYVGEIDPAIFDLPKKSSDGIDMTDSYVKMSLLIQDDEYLYQMTLDIELRRQLWKTCLFFACNLNDQDLITQIMELSKVVKLDSFLSESLVQVNGTIFSQICNLPLCTASTLHFLLGHYQMKITTNSTTLGIHSNCLYKIATKENVVIINQHPYLQQLLRAQHASTHSEISNYLPPITDFTVLTSAQTLLQIATTNIPNLLNSPSFVPPTPSESLDLQSINAQPETPIPPPTRLTPPSIPPTLTKQICQRIPKISHYALHEEAVLQCLYSLLSFAARLKIYRPSILINDLTILLSIHSAAGTFYPHLYDFLISTVMSDTALTNLFRKNTIVNIIDTIYSSPKNIVHQLQIFTEDYYRFADAIDILDADISLTAAMAGHRAKKTNSPNTSKDEIKEKDATQASRPAVSKKSTSSPKKGDDDDDPEKEAAKQYKNTIKQASKNVTQNPLNITLPLFNTYYLFSSKRLATIQLFLNSQTVLFEAMLDIQRYPSSELTSPLDNAVLYQDVPATEYLLSLGFIPLSSTMFHLHQHFIFDHRNATCSDLFSVHGVQPINQHQVNQLQHYKAAYFPPQTSSKSNQPTFSDHFSAPHRFFTPTSTYNFDPQSYEKFVSTPPQFFSFKTALLTFVHNQLQHLKSADSSQKPPPPPPSNTKSFRQRDVYNYYMTSSPSREIFKFLLQKNCPMFQLKLLHEDDRKLYFKALQQQEEMMKSGGNKNLVSMYDILQQEYPDLDLTLSSSRLDSLYTIDFHAVQFHQLFQQHQLTPTSVGIQAPPQISQEDILALLLSAQHAGNPLLIYHLTQTTQLYMSIYTASFLYSNQTNHDDPSSSKPIITRNPPYPCIHHDLPSFDQIVSKLSAQHSSLAIEEEVRHHYYLKFASSVNAILPILAESSRPLPMTRCWNTLCCSYMYSFKRLPSSILLSLTFLPVPSSAYTFDLIQGYLYGFGDPTSQNLSNGSHILNMLLSLCVGSDLSTKLHACDFVCGILTILCGMNNPQVTFDTFHATPPLLTSQALSVNLPKSHPLQSFNKIPLSWPNPYKSQYFYNPTIHFRDVLGTTCSMFLLRRKTIDDHLVIRILQHFILNGEDITATNVLGQNLLMIAIAYQRGEKVLDFLLQPHQISFPYDPVPQDNLVTDAGAIQTTDDAQTHQSFQSRTVKIDINHVDIFGRNIFHYRLNPAMLHDEHLCLDSIVSSPNASPTQPKSMGNKLTPVSANEVSKCDILPRSIKNHRFIAALQKHEDFTEFYPDIGEVTASPPEHQGVRWYELCASLLNGFSGVYDQEERNQRVYDLQYVAETYSLQHLEQIIRNARGANESVKNPF